MSEPKNIEQSSIPESIPESDSKVDEPTSIPESDSKVDEPTSIPESDSKVDEPISISIPDFDSDSNVNEPTSIPESDSKVDEPTSIPESDSNVDEQSSTSNDLETIHLISDEKTILKKMLMDLLIDKSKIDKIKINLNLNDEFLHLLTTICNKYPSMLDDINDSIHDIISDKVIDTKDIPKIIVLVKDIYKKFNNINNLKKNQNISIEDSINFIKNLLLILIELEYIKVDNKDDIIITIDLCIDLLTTTFDVSGSLFDTIKKCFKC